jgi:hypothetical protein
MLLYTFLVLFVDELELLVLTPDSRRHYNEEGISRLTRFFRSFVLPSMGLTSEQISSIIPPEAPNFVSDRSASTFNDASVMPSEDQGVTPTEVSLHTNDLSSVPLTELELNAKPHRLL